MKTKKVPLRKCVASQEMLPKKELIRVVRTPEGRIEIDLTGKKIRQRRLSARGRGLLQARPEEQVARPRAQAAGADRNLRTTRPGFYPGRATIPGIAGERSRR